MGKDRRRAYRRVGAERRLSFYCPNEGCEFSKGGILDGLPLDVVDEDIYVRRPSILIGTVDKFAMLTYRSEAFPYSVSSMGRG